MPDQIVQRRLAAVLAADVAGYTTLMERDTDGTVAAWQNARDGVIDPTVAAHHGRLVKLTGDGFLAEFSTVQDAVECAVEMQGELASNALGFRMGVSLGDIVDDGRDIHGEGVNIAARLQELAEPRGICVSGMVYESIRNRIKAPFEDMGERTVKHVSAPVRVFRVGQDAPRANSAGRVTASPGEHQEVHFCTAPDGVQLAYASVGGGPPLVKTANWLNHLEYDWESPVWRHVFHALSERNTLYRYDQRGNGLSDWDVEDFSFETQVRDLETVIDAAGLDRFDLIGISQGCAIAIAYVVRHPERVSKLILYGGFANGRMAGATKEMIKNEEALLTVMEAGWGKPNPAFRQIFTSIFMPDGSHDEIAAFNELQRISTSPENAVAIRREISRMDVRDLLPQVSVPTLAMHCRDDEAMPFEVGRRMAAGIPGARFVALEGRNHLVLEREPAWPKLLAEIRSFLAEDGPPKVTAPGAVAPKSTARGKPSIAVLPFANMSGDPEQEYFSDGMTEDIITELSKISGLLVIARNSAFIYKGKSVSVKQVGQDLDVGYVLEGSVRKAGNRVRITAQLIDAETDHHLWAERFDRDLEDIFTIQDEVARSVSAAMKVALLPDEKKRVGLAPTANLEAYDLYLRTRSAPWPPSRENILRARASYERIIETDPTFAGGYAGKALTHGMAGFFGFASDDAKENQMTFDAAARALDLDDTCAQAHSALAFANVSVGQFDEAVDEGRTAVELQPSDADAHAILALVLGISGRADEARDEIHVALRLDPNYVAAPYFNMLGIINIFDGRFDDAVDALNRNIARGGPFGGPALTLQVAAYAGAGRIDEAKQCAKRLLEFEPNFRITNNKQFARAKSRAAQERVYDALRKAGLPE